MRTLSATLLAAQKSASYIPCLKAQFVQIRGGSITRTYYKDRILRIINHTESIWSARAEILFDNHDGEFTQVDLRGHEVRLSYGMHTALGDEYSQCQPLQAI